MNPVSEKWKPWVDSEVEPPVAINKYNTMSGPPCAYCKHWKPQVTFTHTELGNVFDGVRCCHANEMHSDFSCFRDAEVKSKNV